MRTSIVVFMCLVVGCVARPPAASTNSAPSDAGPSSADDGTVPIDLSRSDIDVSGDTVRDVRAEMGDADVSSGDASTDDARDLSDADAVDTGPADTDLGDAGPLRYRLPLTIPAGAVAADLENFPLLVDVEDDAIANALATTPGRPFSFTFAGSDLPHEIEVVTPAGRLRGWVLVPDVSANQDTVIYLEFEDGPDQSANVWQDYAAVWHFHPLNQNRTQYRDSTANQNAGTPVGGAPTAGGKVGMALDLDGTQWVEVPDAPSLRPSTFTLSAWVNLPDNGDAVGPVSKPMAVENWDSYQLWVTSSLDLLTSIVHDNMPTADSGGTVAPNSWTHLAYTFDGSEVVHYIDGVEVHSYPALGQATYDDSPLLIGADIDYGAFTGEVLGRIDEARLASGVLEAERLAAEFANQDDPASFVDVGDLEPY